MAKAGRKDRAVVVMRDAVTESADVGAQLTLAQLLHDAGRADGADRVLDDAAKQFPSESACRFDVARCSSAGRTTPAPSRRFARR